MDKQFTSAIEQICAEKNLSKETVLLTIQDALAAAYKKDYGNKKQEVRVEITEDGAIVAYISKEIVEDVEDDMIEISLTDAYKFKKNAKVGDMIEIKDIPSDFGRIAAQTAKQVIIQRIREAERDMVFGEYKDKEGEVVNGIVQRIEGSNVIIDLGKATGILFPNEQIRDERYYVGQRLKFFIVRVEQSARGPQIVISRSHPGLVKRLFELEVPEILSGVVELKSIAREAGERTKIAVTSTQDGVDPVGSCVGQRGVRVQAVMSEIGEEKIDIILWNEDPKVFIANALSPAKVSKITIDDVEKKADVKVAEDQLSLAIGRKGQNVRLAAKLVGWNVDIQGGDEAGVEAVAKMLHPVEDKRDLEDEILKAVESSDEVASSPEVNDDKKVEAVITLDENIPPKETKETTKIEPPVAENEKAEGLEPKPGEKTTDDKSDKIEDIIEAEDSSPDQIKNQDVKATGVLESASTESGTTTPESTPPSTTTNKIHDFHSSVDEGESVKTTEPNPNPKNNDEIAAILDQETEQKTL
ncbi:MAG: transcription termination factor NusA [bacterium]